MISPLQQYLESTFFIDSSSPKVTEFANKACLNAHTPTEKAVALYYAVRDQIRYDPYDLEFSRKAMKASSVIKKGSGYCVSKAVLLTAVARHQNIPCRLGFADVTNHLSSKRLRELMGTDLFVYHGYSEFFLEEKWVKATPAFNLSLCTRFNVKPLEFDGTEDSLFHDCDTLGKKHMEYMRDHGHFADLPFETIFEAYNKTYPNFFDNFGGNNDFDFSSEASRENL